MAAHNIAARSIADGNDDDVDAYVPDGDDNDGGDAALFARDSDRQWGTLAITARPARLAKPRQSQARAQRHLTKREVDACSISVLRYCEA